MSPKKQTKQANEKQERKRTGAVHSLSGTQNLDNATSFEEAPDTMKCMWFAFASAEAGTDTTEEQANSFYEHNKSLLAKGEAWDDGTVAAKLATRYGYTMLPKLMTLGEVMSDPNNIAGTSLVVTYGEGKNIEAKYDALNSSDELTKQVLGNATIQLHAINGKVETTKSGTTIQWRSYGRSHNVNAKHLRAVVFRKLPT